MSRDEDWLLAAFWIVLIQIAFVAALSWSEHFYLPPPLLNYSMRGAIVLVFALSCLLFAAVCRFWKQGIEEPRRAVLNLLKRKRRRLLIGVLCYGLAVLQLTIVTTIKVYLPHVTSFWADPYLAAIDHAIFGTDPWRLAHILPVARFIDTVYVLWFPWLTFVFGGILLRAASTEKARAALSFFLCMGILGVAGIFVLPSAGPIFYEHIGYGQRFAELTRALPYNAMFASNYLWEKYTGHVIGLASGISAMPSMHVTMATWTALTIQSMSRRLAPAGWAFWGLIAFGSVYLGWHYAVDGIVGSIGAVLCWHLAGAFVRSPKLCERRAGISTSAI